MTRYCPECRTERDFETPACPDGHAECPERACTVCGVALVTGWLAVDAPRRGAGRAAQRGASAA